MHWWRILVGFVASIFGADCVIWPLMNWYLHPRLAEHHNAKPMKHTFSRLVGWLERALYTSAILIGAWHWIGLWLALKVAARWRSTSGDPEAPVDNVWLIGVGLSVLFGFLGAWIALGRVPTMPSH
jgi:hypothetical protein